ncbi:MAG: protein kinase domain-containing protein [Nitrospirota bacterium]
MELPAQFGKYRLLHRVGHGGMAELFLAKQTGLKGFEKVLAIKKILPHLTQDAEFVSMFVNEGKLAALLTHQHIVQIFDLDHVNGVYYIAMEYVMGKDLRTVAARARERGGQVPIDLALLICSQVASGLDYAHRRKDLDGRDLNIVHRDVSPQNILVSYEGEVKLVDFGIAKVAGLGQETKTGILKGKLAYMSPEQAMGRAIDRRSDVFALGIVLYEVLTGRRLFKGDSDLSTLEAVRTANVEPPTTFDATIPAELERVVMTALAREAGQRYQTSADFQAALEGVLSARGGTGTMQLSQFMASLFAEDQRKDHERLQSIHHEPARPAAPVRAASAPTPAPARRASSVPRPAPPRVVAPRRHPVRTAVLGAVLLFLLGSGTVLGMPRLLAWMRTQSPEVAGAGARIEGHLASVGLSRLLPPEPNEPRRSVAKPRPDPAPFSAAAPPVPVPSEDAAPVAQVVPAVAGPDAPPAELIPASAPSVPDPKGLGHRDDVKRLLREARDLYAKGRLNEVEEVLRTVIERAPDSPMAYHLLGTVYLERKDEERALSLFSEASHQFPDDAVLHYDLGFLYAQGGLNDLAREELTRALELEPQGRLAARARLYLQTGTVGRPTGPPLDHADGGPPGEFSGRRPPDHPPRERVVFGEAAPIDAPGPVDPAVDPAAAPPVISGNPAGAADDRSGGKDVP